MAAATQSQQDVQELKEELKNLASIVQKSFKHANSNGTAGTIASLTGMDSDQLRKMARRAGKDVRSYLSTKADQAADYYHTAEEIVAENPVRSVLTAAAVGYLLSAFMRSGKSD